MLFVKKYLLEIKNRSILILINFFSIAINLYINKEFFLFLFVKSVLITNAGNANIYYYFIFTNVTEIFSVYIKLSIFILTHFLFYYTLLQNFVFMSSAFYKTEYFYLKLLIKLSLVFFLIFSFLSYFYIVPSSWEFFLNYQLTSNNLYFEAKLNEYFDFYISIHYYCVVYSQIFVLLYVFLSIKKINIVYVKKNRKLIFFFLFIFSTLISTPELFSQILIGFVLIGLYEILTYILLMKVYIHKFNLEAN